MIPEPSPTRRQMLALKLKVALALIQLHDVKDYPARNHHVLRALATAADLGFQCGIKLDPSEPAWPVVFIELPTGQVSWHLPEYPSAYDGHTTEEKYARCLAYSANSVY